MEHCLAHSVNILYFIEQRVYLTQRNRWNFSCHCCCLLHGMFERSKAFETFFYCLFKLRQMCHCAGCSLCAKKRVLRWLPNQAYDSPKTVYVIFVLGQVLCVYVGALCIFELQQAIFIEAAIVHDAFVDGKLLFPSIAVQGIDKLHKLFSLLVELLSCVRVLVGRCGGFNVCEYRRELLNQMSLGGFV